ncbi:CYTH and CHAD domain-containing protein [Nocardioides panacis]|uniref:CYTH and CHAD domain-containing protein n=1 Tax=Nocardioides panacis TaxID=2849501 RepID=A0A975T2X3_9ACTN|nr:CYTH and CHAD domain-containing protein [Nocardioides panacis]QWZ09888.1 CYTH and CHAD domain-containing protein [Nocardioides panacis]
MAAGRWDEVERKLDVDEATMLPTLTGVGGVATTGQPVEVRLEATYFDTADLDLTRHGVTLRRRMGGDDAGWHLKLPQGEDTRTEVTRPLGRATRTVPRDLVTPVRALVRDHPLRPVARVSTRRREQALRDEDGVELAQVCDDHVHAERLHGQPLVQDWREWEVELVHGDRALLDAVAERLLAAGAAPASTSSKLARSLGDAVPSTPRPPTRKQLARGSAAQVLLAHLAEHVAELQRQDLRLRADEPGSVHRLRIAARRLRSALKTYGPLFEPGAVDPLGEELRWLGQALSAARDAQVLRERLHLLVAAEPPELVLGPVMNRIDDELRIAERAGREQALRALDGERYFRLLDSLDELLRVPPLAPGADAAARKVLPRLLQRDARRLRRAVREIDRTEDPVRHDAALHEARKKAKRLRYAAESTVPVFGRRAKKLAASAKEVQQALGEHQDTVMARRTLREHAVRAHANGENGFTFGRLHALEQARAAEAEREFEDAWRGFPTKNLRRWIRAG